LFDDTANRAASKTQGTSQGTSIVAQGVSHFHIPSKKANEPQQIKDHNGPAAVSPAAGQSRSEVLPVSSTFDKVADIIAETSEIDRETITPESHTIDDLGIDSLDFLDIVFAIDKAFGIKIPLEQWTQDVNEGRAPTEEYFVLKNLCGKIDELVAAKKA
jgi:acyl carrier protein